MIFVIFAEFWADSRCILGVFLPRFGVGLPLWACACCLVTCVLICFGLPLVCLFGFNGFCVLGLALC